MEMEVYEKDFIKFVKDTLSHANYFSCVISYENNEDLAWFAALRIGKMIKDSFESELSKQIDIHLCFKIDKIIIKLNEMNLNDIVLISIDDVNISSLSSYIVREALVKKKSLIFISKEENSLNRPFKEITGVVINVNSLSERMLNCVIEIFERGKKVLKLKPPDNSLINKYHDHKAALLKELIRKQVPELDEQEL